MRNRFYGRIEQHIYSKILPMNPSFGILQILKPGLFQCERFELRYYNTANLWKSRMIVFWQFAYQEKHEKNVLMFSFARRSQIFQNWKRIIDDTVRKEIYSRGPKAWWLPVWHLQVPLHVSWTILWLFLTRDFLQIGSSLIERQFSLFSFWLH